MSKRIIRHLITALAFAMFSSTSAADTLDISPIKDTKGNAPKVVLVELQHETVRVLTGQGIKGRPMILLSDGLALMPPRSEQEAAEAIKSVRSGIPGDVIAETYPTPAAYPIDGSNYISYLFRLGIIDSVYWIPPVKGSVGEEPLENFKDYLRSYGATEPELKAFKQEKTYIKGSVNGVPMSVCGLGEFSPPIRDSVLVIDVAFLSMLYSNEITEPMLDLFANFARTISELSPKVSHVVISYSTAFGDVPLERRFLGNYINTLFTDPDALNESPPETWLIRSEEMYKDTFFQVEESLQLQMKAVEIAPDDASLRYDLALGYFSMKDIHKMKEQLDKAVRLDNGYYPAYFWYADYFTDKGIYEASRDFLAEAEKYAPDDPRIMLGFHKLYKAENDMQSAISVQQRLIDKGFDSVENIAQLAEDYLLNGDYKKAAKTYNRVIGMIPVMGDDRVTGLLLGLAETYEKARMLDEASETYRKAVNSTTNTDVRRMISQRYERFRKDWEPFMEPQVD